MWLSVGDLGTGVTVGSPNIILTTSDSPGTNSPASTSTGIDFSTIYKSPYFWGVIVIVLFIFSRRK